MSIILAIESSCDDTSAAVLRDDVLLSNVIASQKVHEQYGGVVPELASRAHEQNIIPVVDGSIRQAGIDKKDIDAVAFTRGPGLMGSLMVGVSFAKSFAQALSKPIIEVNHLQAHVLSHFINRGEAIPEFPFICLLVSIWRCWEKPSTMRQVRPSTKQPRLWIWAILEAPSSTGWPKRVTPMPSVSPHPK